MDTSKVKSLQKKVDSLLSNVKGCPNLDSIKKVIVAKISSECKPKSTIVTKTITDTIVIENPALKSNIYILDKQVKDLQSQNQKLQDKFSEMKDKRDYWRVRFFVLLGVIILYFAIRRL